MEKIAKQQSMPVKAYSIGQLVDLYGVSLYVLHKWLEAYEKEIGKPIARTFNVHQVGLIFQKFGVPGQYIELY